MEKRATVHGIYGEEATRKAGAPFLEAAGPAASSVLPRETCSAGGVQLMVALGDWDVLTLPFFFSFSSFFFFSFFFR